MNEFLREVKLIFEGEKDGSLRGRESSEVEYHRSSCNAVKAALEEGEEGEEEPATFDSPSFDTLLFAAVELVVCSLRPMRELQLDLEYRFVRPIISFAKCNRDKLRSLSLHLLLERTRLLQNLYFDCVRGTTEERQDEKLDRCEDEKGKSDEPIGRRQRDIRS